jgi:hypothetical protein
MEKGGKSDDYTAKWKAFRQRGGDTNPEASLKICREKRGARRFFYFKEDFIT